MEDVQRDRQANDIDSNPKFTPEFNPLIPFDPFIFCAYCQMYHTQGDTAMSCYRAWHDDYVDRDTLGELG